MYVTAVTELDAVNEVLSGIGELPINSLEDNGSIDAANALRILQKNNRTLQQKGWSFNTFSSYKLNPDINTGKIRWNNDIIAIVDSKYIKRGSYVFDIENNTDIFESAIEVECIKFEEFSDLPEAARRYIIAVTMKEFQTRFLGIKELVEMSMREEQAAWADLLEYDLNVNNYNMLTGNTTIQSNLSRSI